MTEIPSPQPAPTAHDLKTDPEVFDAVLRGDKTFEIRFNDRGFKVGDTLHLLKTVHTGAEMKAGAPLVYTCDEIVKTVSHVLTGYGLAEGWCCLSFAAQPIQDERAAFEAWAPSQHMRTERWAVNPELYDDEDAISAWSGWQARAALAAMFDAVGFRAWVRKNLPDDTIIGNSAWWADHLTAWAGRFVKAAVPAPEGGPDLRAAAQQAADALEKIARHFGLLRLGVSTLADSTARSEAHAAIEALRAALAAQPQAAVATLPAQEAPAAVPMCSEQAVLHALTMARSETHQQGDAALWQAFGRAMWRQFNAMAAAAQAPAEGDSRAAFESWVTRDRGLPAYVLDRYTDGRYCDLGIDRDWRAWSAGLASQAQPKGPVFLARDVAELLGIGVPELSTALVALGFPQRSQGMAVDPLEALAVCRARAAQAPAPGPDRLRYECETHAWSANTMQCPDCAAAQAPAVEDKEQADKRMFEQAVRSLAAIDDALGIGDDGCGDLDSTLTAIAELKLQASAPPAKTPFDTCPTCEALARTVMLDQTGSDASLADALDAKRYRFIKSYDNPDSPLAICSWRDIGWDGEWVIEHNPDDVIDAAMASHPPVQPTGGQS